MNMRLNKWIASQTAFSRRGADTVIADGRVLVNGKVPSIGQAVNDGDIVRIDGHEITMITRPLYIMFNKPIGYVCSRRGQGNPSIYSLLPESLKHLQPVGRLDKDSSGLLLMTNDGDWLHKMAHPSNNKNKRYEVDLHKVLDVRDAERIHAGVNIGDARPSTFQIFGSGRSMRFEVVLSEGRNRQIRRTFEILGYKVTHLHRISYDTFNLSDIPATQRYIAFDPAVVPEQ